MDAGQAIREPSQGSTSLAIAEVQQFDALANANQVIEGQRGLAAALGTQSFWDTISTQPTSNPSEPPSSINEITWDSAPLHPFVGMRDSHLETHAGPSVAVPQEERLPVDVRTAIARPIVTSTFAIIGRTKALDTAFIRERLINNVEPAALQRIKDTGVDFERALRDGLSNGRPKKQARH